MTRKRRLRFPTITPSSPDAQSHAGYPSGKRILEHTTPAMASANHPTWETDHLPLAGASGWGYGRELSPFFIDEFVDRKIIRASVSTNRCKTRSPQMSNVSRVAEDSMRTAIAPTGGWVRQAAALGAWLAFCYAAAATGFLVSQGEWFARLKTPSWNPPSWLFGPVWTLLYAMMAVAAWLVWRNGGWKAHRWALGIFSLQWLFNALWTPLFFGAHLIGIAFIDIMLLWTALLATCVLFWRVSRPAGALLAPYLAWVSFAAVLNYSIWRLNP